MEKVGWRVSANAWLVGLWADAVTWANFGTPMSLLFLSVASSSDGRA